MPEPQERSHGNLGMPWWEWERATGDWFGLRPALENRGLGVEAEYSADFFQNLRGGQNSADAFAYRGLFDLSLTLDTKEAGLWDGGILFVHFQSIHGRSITAEHVGALQDLNNADAPDRTQVAEYIYEQHLWDDRLQIKLGKMDANSDFAYVDYGLEFIHSSAGYPPVIPLPTFPDPALGVVARIEPVKWMYLAAGVYDAQGSGDRWGFDSALHGPDYSVTLVELGFKPVFRLGDAELSGTYKVGTWYDSGSWLVLPDRQPREDDPRPPPPEYHRGNSGIYFMVDQLLHREAAPPSGEESNEPVQGLGTFFQFAWAPSAYNEISQYYGAGLQYTGLISGRDEDVTGLGMFHASLSGRIQSLEERYSETAIELFHKFQLTPSLSIKPDFQYVANPGVNGRDAMVLGVRVEMAF